MELILRIIFVVMWTILIVFLSINILKPKTTICVYPFGDGWARLVEVQNGNCDNK